VSVFAAAAAAVMAVDESVEFVGATVAVAVVVEVDVGSVAVGLATATLVHTILKTARALAVCEIVRMNLDKLVSPIHEGRVHRAPLTKVMHDVLKASAVWPGRRDLLAPNE
jgi:hypothetical protein